MRYVVHGAGAVGGVVGGRLHAAGLEVTLVARGEHLAAIRRDGLRVDRADGEHLVHAPATDSAAGVEWHEDTVVLLCVKSHQSAAALEDLLAHAPADTPVVCVQNGLANEDAVLRRFAAAYGVAVMLPCTHLEPGRVVERSARTPGILDIGRAPTGVDDLTDAVAADLRAAGFASTPRPDILAWKRRKLLLNLGNGVDAAFAPGEDADELTRRARTEAEDLLARLGEPVVSIEDDQARRGDHLRRREDLDAAGGSTWQSLTRGQASEIDYLTGEVVLLGRRHGLATPVNGAVLATVHALSRTGGAPRSMDAAAVLADLETRRGPATSR